MVRNVIKNINGAGPGYLVQQNGNSSTGTGNVQIQPNFGLFSGIDIREGLATIGGETYADANWFGDTTTRNDFSVELNGEANATFGIKTSSSSNVRIQRNIIGNVICQARGNQGLGSFIGILCQGSGSHTISKNTIRRLKGEPAVAISVFATGLEQMVDSNNIGNMIVGGDSTRGIHIGGKGSAGILRGNRYYGSSVLTGVDYVNTFLDMQVNGIGQGWKVYNNQISADFNKWSGRFSDRLSGICHSASGGVPTKYYFNTVYLSGPLGDPGYSSAAFRKTGAGRVELKNNIFYNETGGGAGAHYGIAVNNTNNWNGNNVTNNLFYAQGGNSFLGLIGSTQITDINTWEGTAGGTSNLESYIEWKYPQPDNLGRLQLSGENCPIKDKGINVQIFDDYDSLLVRDKVKPDIGSHEFSNEIPLGAYWVGGINNDWHLEGNWCDEKVPQSFEDVTISNLPRRKNMPIVSTDDAVCRNIKVIDNPGSMLTVWGDNANLTFYGDSGKVKYTHDNLAHISGKITFGSDTVQSIPAPVTDLNSNRRNLDLIPLQIQTVTLNGVGAIIKTVVGDHKLTFGEFVKFAKLTEPSALTNLRFWVHFRGLMCSGQVMRFLLPFCQLEPLPIMLRL
jgi:hypothetical protein